ncbi:unnamed protein product [Callosobruchus maculatus]|uniref:C2H2-type domain-containing protein n=1 Tax=Callosobruchus maculatus TaxID=64391 RepID=A0A653CYB7_CALMS|nr:unnamed protein product [Callosobruchus maculatus]
MKHPHLIASVSSKIHECTHCTYKTTLKGSLDYHMLKHSKTNNRLSVCVHCDATFKNGKRSLDDHIMRKHPEYSASVSSKIYDCTRCTFKTVKKALLAHHMLKHPETADSYKFSKCIHCSAKFKQKICLDDHILRKHPEYSASVSSKTHECTRCSYKTVLKAQLARHMLKHPETADGYKFSTCIYCNAKYKQKICLDDHILRKHPEHIVSTSSKILECAYCPFKTVMKTHLARHMLRHPEAADSYKLSTCVHCNATFKTKRSLDEHMLKKHPYFAISISSKIYECMHCAYKTTKRGSFTSHILKHF